MIKSLTNKAGKNWVLANIGQSHGLIPKNYIEFLPQKMFSAKALFNFKANVTNELSFKKEDILSICYYIDEVWALGEWKKKFG